VALNVEKDGEIDFSFYEQDSSPSDVKGDVQGDVGYHITKGVAYYAKTPEPIARDLDDVPTMESSRKTYRTIGDGWYLYLDVVM
jgi:hypothetical protein